MYLDQVNYELNKKINDFVCNSNDATTPDESIDILNQAVLGAGSDGGVECGAGPHNVALLETELVGN